MHTHTEELCLLKMKELGVSTKIPPGKAERTSEILGRKNVNPKYVVHIFTHVMLVLLLQT